MKIRARLCWFSPPTFNLLRRELLPLWRKTLSNQSINLLPHYLTDKWLVWFNRCRDLNCYQKYLYISYVINIDTVDVSNQTWTFLYSSNDKPGYNNIFWLHLLRDILTKPDIYDMLYPETRLYNPLNLLRRGVWSCLVIMKCQIKCMLHDDFTFVICSKWYADFGLLENVTLPRYILLVIKSRTADRKSICSCQWKLDFFFHLLLTNSDSWPSLVFKLIFCSGSNNCRTKDRSTLRSRSSTVSCHNFVDNNLTIIDDVIWSMILNSENSINNYHLYLLINN